MVFRRINALVPAVAVALVTMTTRTAPIVVLGEEATTNHYGDDHYGDPLEDLSYISFSKFTDESYKLHYSDFPLTKEMQAEIYDKGAVSTVVCKSDLLPRGSHSPSSLEQLLRGPHMDQCQGPPRPTEKYFWKEFDFVTKSQVQRMNCGDTLKMKDVWPYVPRMMAKMTLNQCAEAVHDEPVGFWQYKYLIKHVFGNKEYELDGDVIQKHAATEFLRGPVMLADLNTWSIGAVGQYNFCAKWKYGHPRPEEIAWMIKKGEIDYDSGVDDYVMDRVYDMMDEDEYSEMPKYTSYEEGCPKHPSWPAMHSAASNMSFWMAVLFNLTKEQWEEIKYVDYTVGFCRTVAGVHYTSDNLCGLQLGQEVLSYELPHYLHRVYGADIEYVKKKIEEVRFNWFEYDHSLGGDAHVECSDDDTKKKVDDDKYDNDFYGDDAADDYYDPYAKKYERGNW